jgi:hypothetical protein
VISGQAHVFVLVMNMSRIPFAKLNMEECAAYHVERDDIFERDLASLEPSHEVFVNAFGR